MAQVIAHRGARSIAPENTLAAAQIACHAGADLWETDVNITKDNQLILFHDETLLRCTDAKSKFPSRSSYLVREFDFDEIKSLDAGSYFIAQDPFHQISAGNVDSNQLSSFKKADIPSLAQGLLFTKKNKWTVNLELKSFSAAPDDTTIPDQTLDVIYQTHIGLSHVIISSFNHDWLERINKKEPRIEIQALMGEKDDDPLDFEDFRFPVYNINVNTITPVQIKLLKSRGKKVNLFTVNDPEIFSQFERLGVDGIFSDFPQRFSNQS